MISQRYVETLETVCRLLHQQELLRKRILCDILDQALFATRCPGQNYNANNRAGRRPHIGSYCRSNMADQGLLQGNTAGLTKEHVVPESVLWDLFLAGTPMAVIAALYNVAFITQGTREDPRENQRLLRSSMPEGWEPPQTLDQVTNDVAWARYLHAGLFDDMILEADYVGDWIAR